MSFSGLMNNIMTVKRKTYISDGMGGRTYTTSDIYTEVPCRLMPMGGTEMFIYGKENVEATHKLFYQTVYSLLEDDVVSIDDEEFDISLIRNIDRMNHHYETLLRRIKTGI